MFIILFGHYTLPPFPQFSLIHSMSNTNTPLPVNAHLVEETAPQPPLDNASPGWSTQIIPGAALSRESAQAYPSGPVRRVAEEGSVLPELATLLAELQVDRLSRQEESARSQERFAMIERWMRSQNGGQDREGSPRGPLGGPQVVPGQTRNCKFVVNFTLYDPSSQKTLTTITPDLWEQTR